MEELYESIGELLDRIARDGAGDAIREMGRKIGSKKATAVMEALQGYERFFAQFATAIRVRGALSDEDYETLESLAHEIQNELHRVSSVPTPPNLDDHGRQTLRALHYLGGLETDPNDPSWISLFISPRLLARALSVASLLNAKSLKKHIAAIAQIRGDTETARHSSEAYQRSVKLFVKELAEKLREIVINEYLPLNLKSLGVEGLAVEYIATATDYYDAGIDYYAAPDGKGVTHYILATTSGILLPQDYYGAAFYERILHIPTLAELEEKNPRREAYFKALADVRGRPRWYFFEIERASISFRKTLGELQNHGGDEACDIYRQHSRDTIARFLQLDGFGLFGVSQFPKPFDYLTLGNGRHLLLSGRNSPSRTAKIGHGLWLRPKAALLADLQKDLKFTDWVKGIVIGASVSLLDDDPRRKLLDVFLGGFALPMVFALAKQVSRIKARDHILDIGQRITESLENVTLPFQRYPNSRSLSDREARDQASMILDYLEAGG